MANIILLGADEAASSDFTLAAGVNTTLCLNSASATASLPKDASALIQYKTAAGYAVIGKLNYAQQALVLSSPGSFRVVRQSCSAPGAAVDRD